MKCPLCHNHMVERKVPFNIEIGNTKKMIHISTYICPFCGYDENNKTNKKLISSAINETMLSHSINILTSWKSQNLSFSEIERCFMLPARTLSKWYNHTMKPSAAAIQLIRIINAFPWMIKAAEVGFETDKAKQYARSYYISEFNDCNKKITYTSTQDEHIYTAVIKKKSAPLPKDFTYLAIN